MGPAVAPPGRSVPRSLFLTQDFPPRYGGSQSYHWGLIQTLHPDDVVVLAPDHPEAAAFDGTHPYRVVRWHRQILLPSPSLLGLVEGLARERGLELVQMGHPLPNGLLGPRIESRTGLPYVVFLAGAEVTLPAALPGSGAAIRHVLRGAARLFTVSEYTAREASRIVRGRVPVDVLRPAVDGGAFGPPPSGVAAEKEALGVRGPLVVCVGRLVPRKGQDRLVDVVALLRNRYPDLVLALVGGGRLARALVRRADAQGVGDRVRVLGPLPPAELARWLRAADLFASPCRDRWGGLEVEGFGIVFAEASLAGLPVLAGRSGGAPEAVRVGDTGIVVDGRSAAEVAEAVDRILRLRPSRREEMGRAARELALERHEPRAVALRYRESLRQATGR